MTPFEWGPILPQIILIIGAMLILLLEPFTPPARKSRLGQIAVFSCAVAAYSLGLQWHAPYRGLAFSRMFAVDNFSIFFQWLFMVIAGVSALIAMRFNERESMNRGEYYALLLMACSGMSLMGASNDLLLTFLGLEILSIATYVLAGFKRSDARANESALKYFLLGSFASSFLLYGIALVYGTAGSTNYTSIREALVLQRTASPLMMIGLGFLLVGFGFKIAAAPFHSWVPDVYEGAPTPVTAFMTVGPKAAGFAALVRLLAQAFPALEPHWSGIIWVSAILTMTIGNVVALLQRNLKRMLAYSAIAHAGYLLIGIVAHKGNGFSAILFYLIVYSVMNIGAFSILLSLSRKGDLSVNLEDYSGLGQTSPFAAAMLSIFLVSLAGIPLTGGFIGKFYLFSAAVQRGFIGLAVIGVLNSVVSVFYYFRVIVFMYMKEPVSGIEQPTPLSLPISAIVLLGALATLWLGIYPGYFLNLASYSTIALR